MLVLDAFESHLTLGARSTIHAMNTGCVVNIWKDDFIIKHSTKYTFQRSFETMYSKWLFVREYVLTPQGQ
jgi:hypothetical protein